MVGHARFLLALQRSVGNQAVQRLVDPEKTTFVEEAQRRVKQVNVDPGQRAGLLQQIDQIAKAAATPADAERDLKTALSQSWKIPRGNLGDLYLGLRNTLRPDRPNTGDVRSGVYKENCLLVAVAAVVGKTTDQIETDLGFGRGGSGSKAPIAFAGPKAAEKYSALGSLADDEAQKLIGSLQAYLNENMKGSTDEARAQQLKDEWMQKRVALDLGNAKLQAAMIDYVVAQLGAGIRVRGGGSPSKMMPVADGIKLMETCTPGTQFVVYLEGDKKGAPGAHYVYANNFGGDVTFVDYQPLAKGVAKTPESEFVGVPPGLAAMMKGAEKHIPDKHPMRMGGVTPPPFATEENGPQYAKMCFLAFEPNVEHVLTFIEKVKPAPPAKK